MSKWSNVCINDNKQSDIYRALNAKQTQSVIAISLLQKGEMPSLLWHTAEVFPSIIRVNNLRRNGRRNRNRWKVFVKSVPIERQDCSQCGGLAVAKTDRVRGIFIDSPFVFLPYFFAYVYITLLQYVLHYNIIII